MAVKLALKIILITFAGFAAFLLFFKKPASLQPSYTALITPAATTAPSPLNNDENKNMEKITLKTKDGVEISADHYPVENPRGAVLLVHMMPATKESWEEFAQKLNQDQWSALAIDLRGHGQSIKSDKGPLNYSNFTDQDHQSSINDLTAAIEFLKQSGFNEDKIALAGASIGANLALQKLSENHLLKSAALFSAGLDYRGIKTEPLAKKLNQNQNLLLIAGTEDMRSSGQSASQMAEIISKAAKSKNEIRIFKNSSAHGTDLLNENPELTSQIIAWLNQIYTK